MTQPPIEFMQVGLTGPAARSLADMTSLAEDLAFASDCAAGFAVFAEMTEADPIITRALWTAAAISYRRAFGSGKAMLEKGKPRLQLDRKMVGESEELSVEQREAHTLTLDLADKHIAHRVGETEDIRVVALLSPPPAERELAGIGLLHVRMLGPEPHVAVHLAEVARALSQNLTEQVTARRGRLLEHLVEAADLDNLYADAEMYAAARSGDEPDQEVEKS